MWNSTGFFNYFIRQLPNCAKPRCVNGGKLRQALKAGDKKGKVAFLCVLGNTTYLNSEDVFYTI